MSRRGPSGYVIPLVVIVVLAFSVAHFGEQGIKGGARIQSGNRLVIDGRIIRLDGIAAPELGETCGAGAEEWDCGRRAMAALSGAIDRGRVICEPTGDAERGKLSAVCRVREVELGALMVREGWARAAAGAPPAYLAAEKAARRAGKGIWRGLKMAPEKSQHVRPIGTDGEK